MRRVAAHALLAFCLAAPGALAEDAPRASASMRVALLAERIAKQHAQVGLGVLPERSRRALAVAQRDLESAARSLALSAQEPELRDNFILLAILVRDVRPWMSKPATRENARALAERCEEIVWVAEEGARKIEQRRRTPPGSLALQAVQAATLAQRVARLHLLRRGGMAGPSAGDPQESMAALRARLALLAASARNTPAIDAELQVSRSQLDFLVTAAKEADTGALASRRLEFIAKSADHLAESMERVAQLYEALVP